MYSLNRIVCRCILFLFRVIRQSSYEIGVEKLRRFMCRFYQVYSEFFRSSQDLWSEWIFLVFQSIVAGL